MTAPFLEPIPLDGKDFAYWLLCPGKARYMNAAVIDSIAPIALASRPRYMMEGRMHQHFGWGRDNVYSYSPQGRAEYILVVSDEVQRLLEAYPFASQYCVRYLPLRRQLMFMADSGSVLRFYRFVQHKGH
jgi:hypothetical protein